MAARRADASPVDVCFVVGARPNFMKTAPVYEELSRRSPGLRLVLVHTGQHHDPEMSDVFLRDLGLPQVDEFLAVGGGTHAEQTAKALVRIERVLVERRPAVVVVAGDVNSTLAGALAAVKLMIRVAHIESGLRSFDDSMPEEHNRRLTDHVSSLLFAHSSHALANLENEGIPAERVHLVGNTMIDSLLRHVDRARAAEPWLTFGLTRGQYALVTLHRPALVDDEQRLRATAAELIGLATKFAIAFTVHPRTRERLRASRLEQELSAGGVTLLPPLGYTEFLGLESGAAFVVTDSGGVQEETSVLGVPCFTLRDTTERPVTSELGTNTVLGSQPTRLREIPRLLASAQVPADPIPLWDGAAGARAADVLAAFVERGRSLDGVLGARS
jgi:UDP-N-acetylglucosamine 2-epimerase (non-hydrolysing)